MIKPGAALLGLLVAAGCTPHLALLPIPLPVPEPPVLPTITETEVHCLTDEVWRKIVMRDAARAADAAELRAILRAINGQPLATEP